MNLRCFHVTLALAIVRINSFGENDTGTWRHNVSTPSAVYPFYGFGKTQGVLRIHIRPRTTILSSTSTTTTTTTTTLLPFDSLIEEYLKKKSKNRFDDWHLKANSGYLIHVTLSIYLVNFLCNLLFRLDYY